MPGRDLRKLEELVAADREDPQGISDIIKRYIMDGAPFADLDAETSLHCIVANR